MLLKQQIIDIYEYQKAYYRELSEGVHREKLETIDFSDSHIKIITGIRRCGKSTLMLQIARQQNSVHFLSFEDPRLTQFEAADFFKLEEIFQNDYKSGIYFFDEIQNVNEWEKYVRLLHDKNVKVVISGSNVSLLSKEFGTSLTGRQITYELFPFSFLEFIKYTEKQKSVETFNNYLSSGGFPEYLKTRNKEVLIHLFNDLIYRDIVVRHGLRNSKIVRDLAVFLATNIGKEFSYNKLAKYFELGSVNTVQSYISYFEDSYLFFTIPRFSYSLKQQAKNQKKIYCVDTGMVNNLSLSFSSDIGRILENSVFISLRRKGEAVYFFKNKWECDFVIALNKEVKQAIQVCYDLNSDNLQREMNGLFEAMETFNLAKGLILTLNQHDSFQKDNKIIDVVPVWEWMLENDRY